MERWERRWARAGGFALLGAGLLAAPGHARTGDLNGNGVIDAGDARIALQIAGGQLDAAGRLETGDVAGPNGGAPDGKLTLLDAARIARAASGLDDLGGGTDPNARPFTTKVAVTVAGDTMRDIAMAPGYLLTGTVKDTKGGSISGGNIFSGTSGSIVFTSAGAAEQVTASVAKSTGAFSAVLPAGASQATVFTTVNAISPVRVDYTTATTPTPGSVTSTTDAAVDFVRPDLPASGTLSGAINAPGVTLASRIVLNQAGGGSARGSISGTTYTLTAAPGPGTFLVTGNLTADTRVETSARLNTSPVTVVSGAYTARDITLPALTTVHGSITPPAGYSPYAVEAETRDPGAGNVFTSHFQAPSGGSSYALAVPAGEYDVTISLSGITTDGSALYWDYDTVLIVPAGDTSSDFTLPALPAVYTVQGTVTAPNGTPLANAIVRPKARPASGTEPSGWSAWQNTRTDASGAYKLILPPADYDFTVTPPAS